MKNKQNLKNINERALFKHEEKWGTKKESLDQISTPFHISEFMHQLIKSNDPKISAIVDIACGGGSLLLPWKETGFLMIGADIDEEALSVCKENISNNIILFKHNSLQCETPCEIKEHLYYSSFNVNEFMALEKNYIHFLNPPFSLVDKMISKVLNSSNQALIITPLSVAIGTKYKKERVEWLKKSHLEGVLTLPKNLFSGQKTNVHTCLIHWNKKANTSFTYLANFKDDGFVVLKGKRIDKENRWKEIKKQWIAMYQSKDISNPTLSINKKLTALDCWLADAWVETDYSKLTEKNFEKTIRDYLAFRISVLEGEDLEKNER